MIRWLRLLNTSKIILEKYNIKAEIDVHLSTAMPDNIRANVQGDITSANILLSALHNKTEENVIESLAHELAHIVCHNNNQLNHKKIQEDILTKFKEVLCAL